MSANIFIKSTAGSDIRSLADADLAGVNLADKTRVEFGSTFIAIKGAGGNSFNLIGTFGYLDPATTEYDQFTGGTVTAMTLKLADDTTVSLMNSFSLDASTVLATLTSGSSDQVFGLLGQMKFTGAAGADIMKGSVLNDVLIGGAGADQLSGSDGNDIIEGGLGADHLGGDLGIDTLTYKNSSAGVNVSLKAGTADGGEATGDRFTGFENLAGSRYNDTLTGNNGSNVLSGGQGNDILSGGLGNDQLIGATGVDTADYSDSRGGVTIDLLAGTATGGYATGDVLTEIENLKGSISKDYLTGNNAANLLDGGEGSDILSGGMNKDRLIGGLGNDRLDGGAAFDTLFGNAGSDTFVLTNLATSTDAIMDFEAGIDVLEVKADQFNGGLVAGVNLTAAQLEINTTGFASTRDVRFILNSATGELFYDNNGSAGDLTSHRLIATFESSVAGFSIGDFDII